MCRSLSTMQSVQRGPCCTAPSSAASTSVARPCIAFPRHSTSRRASQVRAAQQSEEGFLDSVKRVAKKVQGALPVIGLLSRLTSTEGGFDELAYPEYCRSIINSAPPTFKKAMADIEKKYGKVANSKWLLLVLWMAKTGVGLVPAKDIISAARRLRITQDMEIEIDRFDITRTNTLKKYSMMQAPQGKTRDKVCLGVDAIATLCIGLKDGEAVGDADAELLVDLLQGAFPEAEPGLVKDCVTSRPQRTY